LALTGEVAAAVVAETNGAAVMSSMNGALTIYRPTKMQLSAST
jgi:hypothetical protein